MQGRQKRDICQSVRNPPKNLIIIKISIFNIKVLSMDILVNFVIFPTRQRFTYQSSFTFLRQNLRQFSNDISWYSEILFEPLLKKTNKMFGKKRRRPASRFFAVTAKLISAFVFATRIVQSLFFLNPKFQASSLLL